LWHSLQYRLTIFNLSWGEYFLTGGQLLGTVRQGAFAGRPQDVDLGLIDTLFDKFYKNIHLIKKN